MLTFVFCMPGKKREAECKSAFVEGAENIPCISAETLRNMHAALRKENDE